MWFLLSFVTLLSALSLVWRIVLVQSQTFRRIKLQWTYLQKREEGGPPNHDLVNPISVTHSNYLFFELFGQNFTKSLIRKTLVQLCSKKRKERNPPGPSYVQAPSLGEAVDRMPPKPSDVEYPSLDLKM